MKWAILALAMSANAAPLTVERESSVAQLFDAEQARELARTLPADLPVKFWLRLPPAPNPGKPGLVVFVKPQPPGEIPSGWAETLDRHNLAWVSAGEYGNDKPTAQRVLTALMAVKLVEQLAKVDPQRIYIAGMSGGGRVASEIITRFPQRFAGALYIVGANDVMPEESLLPLARTRRFVFITGSRDFNRHEMRRLFARYQRAGLSNSLMIDQPGFGHEYPDAMILEQSLDYLLDVTQPAPPGA